MAILVDVLAGDQVDVLGQFVFAFSDVAKHFGTYQFAMMHDGEGAEEVSEVNVWRKEGVDDLPSRLFAI